MPPWPSMVSMTKSPTNSPASRTRPGSPADSRTVAWSSTLAMLLHRQTTAAGVFGDEAVLAAEPVRDEVVDAGLGAGEVAGVVEVPRADLPHEVGHAAVADVDGHRVIDLAGAEGVFRVARVVAQVDRFAHPRRSGELRQLRH